jgi:hypothetical protein
MSDMERMVAQDIDELIWLRLNRLTSVQLCEKILKSKLKNSTKNMDTSIITNKAIGMSSSIESSINYWNFKTNSLNLRILSRYYALLHMTIAEQVSSINNDYDLSKIQKYTEMGHGMGTLRDDTYDFPNKYYISLINSGYFHSYAKHLGMRKIINKIAFNKKPTKLNELDVEDKKKLIPLTSLLRRIPELRPVIYEYLALNPLSFRTFFSSHNPSDPISDILELHPVDGDISKYDYANFNWPFKNVQIEKNYFLVEYKYAANEWWFDTSNNYSSNYCGNSYILPLHGIDDPILFHLMILYSLSIIARYLPDLWYEIYHGQYDHMGSLIDYYISVFDHVIPLKMLERITGKKIQVTLPGSIDSDI